jgi:uncharacterized metal-binding protein YceD (DUF177 family)
MTTEFSRPVAIDTIGAGRTIAIEAGEDERRRLAGRFGWVSLDRLDAEIGLTPRAGAFAAAGRLRAVLVQRCVATGEPVPETIDEDFAVRFVERAMLAAGEEEVELGEDDLDVLDYEGSAIDIGEAVAQTLALAVEPFPRVADAEARLREAGVVGEGESGAFAGLKGLFTP